MNGAETFKEEVDPNGLRKEYHRSTDLLLICMAESDPMLSMLEWLCAAHGGGASGIVGAEKMYTAHPAAITAVDIVPGGWIPVWERCTSW
ncbi:hypothetical protein DSECCO2_267150 [anaerobic digester metagenome]